MRTQLALTLCVSLLLIGCSSKPDDSPPVTPPTTETNPPEETPDPTSPPTDVPVSVPVEAPKVESNISAEARDWLVKLGSDDLTVRRSAGPYFDQLDNALDLLLIASSDSDPVVRRGAAYGLLRRRADGDENQQIDTVVKLLSDADSKTRGIALVLVRDLESENLAKALPVVAAMLTPDKEEADRRATVARLLGAAEQEANSVLSAVLKAMEADPDRNVRTACLMSAVKMTPDPGADVADAIARLAKNDKDAIVRKAAVFRLGQLGPRASGQTSAILGAMNDPDSQVRVAASKGLAKIGNAALPGLLQALESEDATMRVLAASALGRMQSKAQSALPALEKLKSDPEKAVQQAAQIAIRRIGGR